MATPGRLFAFKLAILLCAMVADATAGQLDLIVNGRSYHINSSYDWNEQNYGLGLEYHYDNRSRWRWSITGNAFLDSESNPSYMLGGALKRRIYQSQHPAGFYFDAGLVAFLMSRADINDYMPFPGVLPALSVGTQRFGVNLTYLPEKAVRDFARVKTYDPDIRGVLFLQFRFRLSQTSQQ